MPDAAATASKPSPLHYISDHLQDLRNKGIAPKLRVLEGEQKPVAEPVGHFGAVKTLSQL